MGAPESAPLGTTYVAKGLRKARLDKQYPKSTIARLLGVSRMYIGLIELGKTPFPVKMIDEYAGVLGICPDEIEKWIMFDKGYVKLPITGNSALRNKLAIELYNNFDKLEDEDCEAILDYLKEYIGLSDENAH